eukprot:gene8382-9280_t
MASSEDIGQAMKFSKLNALNYRAWTFNMKLYLENQDIFDQVDGTAIAPASSVSEAQRKYYDVTSDELQRKLRPRFVWLLSLKNKFTSGKLTPQKKLRRL